MSRKEPLRILCVDDHPVVREGLALLINLQPDMNVVGSADRGESAVAMFDSVRPDVTLMDLELPGMSGVDAIRAIRSHTPEARIIVLTVHHGNEDIHRALQAGAATYLLKDTLTKELIQIIRSVADGKRPLPQSVAAILADRPPLLALSVREAEILQLVALGMANREVADHLGISHQTVHSHLKHIFEKLDVNDRTAAVSMAVRRGIIHLR